MQISMGLPNKDEELAIMDRFIKQNPLTEIGSVIETAELIELQEAARDVYVHQALREYIVAIVDATRKWKGAMLGVSPRGTLAFLRAVQAYALIQGREYVVAEDVKKLAVPVLSHRLILAGGGIGSGKNREAVQKILSEVPVPTEEWKR
jgi:MoxR-like ATPase